MENKTKTKLMLLAIIGLTIFFVILIVLKGCNVDDDYFDIDHKPHKTTIKTYTDKPKNTPCLTNNKQRTITRKPTTTVKPRETREPKPTTKKYTVKRKLIS